MNEITKKYSKELEALSRWPYVKENYADTINNLDALAREYMTESGTKFAKKTKSMLLPVASGMAVGGLYALGDDTLADGLQKGIMYGAGFSVANTVIESIIGSLFSYNLWGGVGNSGPIKGKRERIEENIINQVKGKETVSHDLSKNPMATGAVYGIEALVIGLDVYFSSGIGLLNGGTRLLYSLRRTPLQKHVDKISDATTSERFAIAGALVKRWYGL